MIDNKLKYFFNKDLAGQAIGNLASEVIDHGDLNGADLSQGNPMFLHIQIEGDVESAGAATVAMKLQHSDDGVTFSDTPVSYDAIAKAELVAGWERMVSMPSGLKRYTRLLLTVATAALTAGQISAFPGNE